jgi:hypothetical protein
MSLPFILVWLSIAEVVRLGQAGATSASSSERRGFLLFACYATMVILWLYPAADIWHVVGVLPSCIPLLAYWFSRLWQLPGTNDRELRVWHLRAGALIGVFVLALVIPPVRDLLWERGAKPAFKQSLPRASGIVGDSALYSPTRSGGKLVRYLTEEERSDEPIYILSAKSLIYFLTDRVSPVQEYEYLLYLTAHDFIREDKARELIDEARLIRRLDEVRPLIIDDQFDEHAESVKLMFPRLAEFIRNHYQLEAEFGRFQVLRRGERNANP